MAENPKAAAERRRATEPLATITLTLVGLMFALLLLGVVASILGHGSVGGFGDAQVCATNSRTVVSNGHPPSLAHSVRPGAYLSLSSPVQVCADHPGAGQRVLYTLTQLPSALVWVVALLLLWRLMRVAARRGPLAIEVAAAMRFLGWFVLIGSVAAILLQGLANQLLLDTMVVHESDVAGIVGALLHGLPIPVLVGAGLLTFARIIRIGAALDEEIKGTI
jgi:hypothetical protein